MTLLERCPCWARPRPRSGKKAETPKSQAQEPQDLPTGSLDPLLLLSRVTTAWRVKTAHSVPHGALRVARPGQPDPGPRLGSALHTLGACDCSHSCRHGRVSLLEAAWPCPQHVLPRPTARSPTPLRRPVENVLCS